ncbi:hypothetical protein MMC25_004411 [Agyrium rufum]|nr:hypothetical protein [Agyrium rufum]
MATATANAAREKMSRTTSMEYPSRVRTSESGILATGEYGYPQGHLGHLNEQQEQALEQFKILCEKEKIYTPANLETGTRASHDDTTMLRFLRARRFVPADGLQQFKDTEKWRKENEIALLYDNIDVQNYEETRKLYPQWTGRRDKRGIPVYVFEVAPLNSKTMAAYAKSSASTKVANVNLKGGTPPKLLRLFALYENLTSFIMPLCSALRERPNADTPISQSNNIVDISNVGLKQFWNLRQHMQDASTLATAHYPETLDRIFVIGAPSFFPTVWSWIKRWFDPITTSKIFILSPQDTLRTLSTFIEPQNIPKKYGGTLTWDYGSPPVLDPAEKDHVTWSIPDPIPSNQGWPIGPLKWVPADNGTYVGMAVGSVDGKLRREIVATLHPMSKDHVGVVKDMARMSISGDRVILLDDQKEDFKETNGDGDGNGLSNGVGDVKEKIAESANGNGYGQTITNGIS